MKRLKWIIWLRYFLYMYEYGTLKSVNVILWRGEGNEEEWWRDWTKSLYNMCVYGNVTIKQST
jgi:hypothetical protein